MPLAALEQAKPSAARYLPHGPFQEALNSRVDAYFERTGLNPQHASGMRLKTLVICTWLVGSYLFALLLATQPWQVALAAMSIGLAMAGIGFNVQHDGGHNAY